MLIPTHTCAGSEGLGDPGNRGQRAEGQLEGAGKISGTVFVRQGKCLLLAQTELASLLVIANVAAGSLRIAISAFMPGASPSPGAKMMSLLLIILVCPKP